jgi:hypothetical protein
MTRRKYLERRAKLDRLNACLDELGEDWPCEIEKLIWKLFRTAGRISGHLNGAQSFEDDLPFHGDNPQADQWRAPGPLSPASRHPSVSVNIEVQVPAGASVKVTKSIKRGKGKGSKR